MGGGPSRGNDDVGVRARLSTTVSSAQNTQNSQSNDIVPKVGPLSRNPSLNSSLPRSDAAREIADWMSYDSLGGSTIQSHAKSYAMSSTSRLLRSGGPAPAPTGATAPSFASTRESVEMKDVSTPAAGSSSVGASYRDPSDAPLRKVTANLIKTYKQINEVRRSVAHSLAARDRRILLGVLRAKASTSTGTRNERE